MKDFFDFVNWIKIRPRAHLIYVTLSSLYFYIQWIISCMKNYGENFQEINLFENGLWNYISYKFWNLNTQVPYYKIILLQVNDDQEKWFYYFFELLDEFLEKQAKWEEFITKKECNFEEYWIKEYRWDNNLYFKIDLEEYEDVLENWLEEKQLGYYYFVNTDYPRELTTSKRFEQSKTIELNIKEYLKDGNKMYVFENWIFFCKWVLWKYLKSLY